MFRKRSTVVVPRYFIFLQAEVEKDSAKSHSSKCEVNMRS